MIARLIGFAADKLGVPYILSGIYAAVESKREIDYVETTYKNYQKKIEKLDDEIKIDVAEYERNIKDISHTYTGYVYYNRERQLQHFNATYRDKLTQHYKKAHQLKAEYKDEIALPLAVTVGNYLSNTVIDADYFSDGRVEIEKIITKIEEKTIVSEINYLGYNSCTHKEEPALKFTKQLGKEAKQEANSDALTTNRLLKQAKKTTLKSACPVIEQFADFQDDQFTRYDDAANSTIETVKSVVKTVGDALEQAQDAEQKFNESASAGFVIIANAATDTVVEGAKVVQKSEEVAADGFVIIGNVLSNCASTLYNSLTTQGSSNVLSEQDRDELRNNSI